LINVTLEGKCSIAGTYLTALLMEEPRVNQDSDPVLQRIKQNLKKADLRGGS